MANKTTGYGDRFCVFCGKRVAKQAEACPHCGKPYGASLKYGQTPALGAGGVGWSDRADDPGFRRNQRRNTFWSVVIMIIVSIIIFAAIYFSGGRDLGKMLPVSLIVLAGLWVFWIIWLILHNRPKKDWEGVVEDKETFTKEVSRRDSDEHYHTRTQHVYVVRFRRDDGKKAKVKTIDNSLWYNYLFKGDRVRFHGNHMNYYEKYDKSQDECIPCASCGTMRDARETYCGLCGAVMLKGAPVQSQAERKKGAQGSARPAAADGAAQGTNVRRCPACGAEMAGGKFCTECGHKLT